MAPEAPCPDIEALEHLATREGGDRSEVAAHVATCATCRAALEEIEKNLRFAEALRAGPAAAPARVGRFTVVREIGRGGMGVVYEAEQAEPRRRVAVKVLRRAGDRGADRMLLREAAALARLNHAGIASIFEAGRAEDGSPYLVMELVHGVPLGEFARERNCGQAERVDLTARVCEAVAAAHRSGVVHRDLKPSNILVSPEGLPKVLDFGLAKLMQEGEGTLQTERGRIAGTIAYMSPEQARGENDAVDTRTDVYALGVILYELLTGALPYRVSARNLPASVRAIAEDAPIRPRTAAGGVRGDLEAVILKAIEKDPGRRYESASALGEDLRRVLRREPVTARAPTLAYQGRALVARYPVASALVAALVVSVVVFGAMMTGLYVRARASEQRERVEAARARDEARTAWETQDFIVRLLGKGNETSAEGRPLSVLDLVREGTRTISTSLTDRPRVRAELLRTLGVVHGELRNHDEARALFEEARGLEVPGEAAGSLRNARLLRDYGSYLATAGDPRGVEMLAEAAARFEASEADAWALSYVVALLSQGLARHRDPVRAEPAIRSLVGFLERHPHHRAALPGALNMLGGSLDRQGRYDEALEVMSRAIEVSREVSGEVTPDIAGCLNNAASVLTALGRLEEAEERAREGLSIRETIYGSDHMISASSHLVLGRVLLARDRVEEATEHVERARRAWLKSFAAGSSPMAEVDGVLGACYMEQGRLEEAEPLLTGSEAAVAKRTTSTVRDRREAMERLVRLYEMKGDAAQAAMWRSRLDALGAAPPG